MDQLLSSTKAWLDSGVSPATGADIELLARNIQGDGGDQEKVVWKCVECLAQLQSLASGKREVIAIALEDMKIVSLLMRLIACYGIYPCVEKGVGPPMDARTTWVLEKTPEAFSPGFLEKLIAQLVDILETKDDLADVILIGPFVVDIMVGSLHYQFLFERLSAILPTYTLYQLYTGILPLGPAWVQQMISHYLAVMPLKRKDAVRVLIEFLTGFRESEHVNRDRLAQVVQVLRSVPKNTSAQEYTQQVGTQLFGILSSIGMPPEIIAATVKVVVDLSEVRPQMLGPLRDKILEPLISPSTNLEPALMALTNLVTQESKFLQYLAGRAALPVWILLAYLSQSKRPNGSTMRMLVGLIDSKPDGVIADEISRSLALESVNGITFGPSPEGSVESRLTSDVEANIDLEQLTFRIDLLMTVLSKVQDRTVSALFARIISRYTAGLQQDPLSVWADVKLLDNISKDLRSKLLSDPGEIADLALGIIRGAVNRASAPERLEVPNSVIGDSDDEDEDEDADESENSDFVALALSLLSSVILEAFADVKVVKRIAADRPEIEVLTHSNVENIRNKAKQCLELINTVSQGGEISLGDDDVAFEDSAALLETARESLANPLIPVRAHGIRLIIELVRRKNVITFDEAVKIMLNEIKDDDSYIYLNAIRGLEACSVYVGPGAVLRKLVEYKAPNIDVTLRVREAMTRITQLFGPTITMDDIRFLVDYFIQQSRPQRNSDDRLRMSAISILGLLVQGSPLSLSTSQEDELSDLVIGVLTHERNEDQAIMRRSAVTLLLDIMNSRLQGGFKNLSPGAIESLKIQLEVATNDDDELIREDAREVLGYFSH